MQQLDRDRVSYGVEHELSDWNCSKGLPEGFARSPDYTIVNSNGIAAQPNVKVYGYGGEINTPGTHSIDDQIDCLCQVLKLHPKCKVNHRSNLHVHIRIPGLKDNLPVLKMIQEFIHVQLYSAINRIEPIPSGTTPFEKKRARRRKVSHHTFLTSQRVRNQLRAETVEEFFEREVPRSRTGKVMWHAQPRVCVNLRQLLQTNTVEFRHFPGTLSSVELRTCIQWCRDFLFCAIDKEPLEPLTQKYLKHRQFPAFPKFDEEMEIGYQATASNNGLKHDEIKRNIQLILEKKFHGSDAYEAAKYRASH